MGNHLEGVPFYGEISCSEMRKTLTGSKRNSPDSICTSQESQESSHLMKMLRHRLGMESSRRSNDEEILLGRRMNLNPATHSQTKLTPFRHQLPSSRFKDANRGGPLVFRPAADEGSRTGTKREEILNSIYTGNVEFEKNKNKFGSTRDMKKTMTCVSESQPSVSISKQMTIFYGGQAHVYDDVNNNKAEIIMALAGSNGGSWATDFLPKSGSMLTKDGYVLNQEPGRLETPFKQEFGYKRVAAFAGGQGAKPEAADARNPVQTTKFGTQEKGKLLEL